MILPLALVVFVLILPDRDGAGPAPAAPDSDALASVDLAPSKTRPLTFLPPRGPSEVQEARFEVPRPEAADDLERALADPRKALLYAHRADLSKLDEETVSAVCRMGATVQLGDISDALIDSTVASNVEGRTEQMRLDSLLGSGLFSGHSSEELAAIRAAHEVLVTHAAEDFCRELRIAVREQWKSGETLRWRNEEPDPGYGGRSGKCVLARAAMVGPYSYRIVVYAEDHPALFTVREHLNDIQQDIWEAQMEYLEPFRKKR
ncbi:MAG: hypothetical protein GY711_30165 [bacterium]|nr:hypothetical protein [bacterium]